MPCARPARDFLSVRTRNRPERRVDLFANHSHPQLGHFGIEPSQFPEAPLRYAGHVEERGVGVFRQVCEMDLEGMVAKHKLSAYGSDELPWIKVLNPRYSQREGRRELFEKRGRAIR